MKLSPKIMIPVVLAIWVIVGWKLVNWTASPPLNIMDNHPVAQMDDIRYRDTLPLKGGYPDPFLGKIQKQNPSKYRERLARNRPRAAQGFLRALPPPRRSLPSFKVIGQVQGPDTNQATVLIQVDSQFRAVQPGDTVAGFGIMALRPHQLILQGADTLIVLPFPSYVP